jgi:hypothetical protein
MTRTASALGHVFHTVSGSHLPSETDADARRIRIELDAIRARFPDHS